MASLGLNIHVDKENAYVQRSVLKDDGSRLISKNKGLSKHATQLKDLRVRPNGTPHPSAKKLSDNDGFLKPPAGKPQQAAPKLSMRLENQLNVPSVPPEGKNENVPKSKQDIKNTVKPKSSAKSKKQDKTLLKPVPDEEDGYDSDTIWPRSERLSSHVHKLLSWRPPCLFGNIEDSDSDVSLSEPDLDIPDSVLMSEPFGNLPEIDLSLMLDDLPDPEKP